MGPCGNQSTTGNISFPSENFIFFTMKSVCKLRFPVSQLSHWKSHTGANITRKSHSLGLKFGVRRSWGLVQISHPAPHHLPSPHLSLKQDVSSLKYRQSSGLNVARHPLAEKALSSISPGADEVTILAYIFSPPASAKPDKQ